MRRRLLALLGAVLATATLGACASGGAGGERPAAPEPRVCEPTGSVAQRDLRFAESPGVAPRLQSLDLYVPKRPSGCPPVALVVYVHGGAFRVGDKANRIADKVRLFTGAGFAFASVNYRLVDRTGSGPTNGRYPAAEEDVADAVGFLVRRAAGDRIDPERVLLLGHSAGAHLVALVSTDPAFLRRAGVRLDQVRCTAPLDTSYDIPTEIAGGGVVAAMYATAFGEDPAIWVRGSPNRIVEPGIGIPEFHIVTRGPPERIAQAESFGTALRGAGIGATVQDVNPVTHAGVNARVGAPGDTIVTPPLLQFFRACARG